MFEKYLKVSGFIPFPLSGNSCYLDENGKIKNERGQVVPQTLDSDGYPQVFADLWDGVRQYRIVDLMAIVFKSVKLQYNQWNEIEGFYIDGDVKNSHASNIGYRFRTFPLQCTRFPDFYHIPMFSRYGINREGELISLSSGKLRSDWCVTKGNSKRNIKGGYLYNGAIIDTGGSTTVLRHRLLCLAFKPYPDNVDKMDVNHIDGVPGNDDLDNLEWVTRSRNNTHAYQNNLKQQHKRVLARNVRTGEVTEFYSISECARCLGYPTDETIRVRLNSTFSQVWKDGYQFKFLDDARDWVIPDDPEEAILDATQAMGVRVRNCRTLEECSYDSIGRAGAVLGIGHSTILYRLKNGLTGPHRGFQFKYWDDLSDWEPFTLEELEDTGSVAKSVEGRNLLTKATCSYPSVKSCYYGQNKPYNLIVNLRSGEQRVYPDGWQYKYVDDQWIEVGDVQEALLESSRRIVARDVLTGEVFAGKDCKDISEKLELQANGVRRAVQESGKSVYNTYQFKYEGDQTPWPELPEEDLVALSSGVNVKGTYKVLTDIKTGDRFYFPSVLDCVRFLKTVNSKPVFERRVRSGELLDGKYKCSTYTLASHQPSV
jgi:hypothetical protein